MIFFLLFITANAACNFNPLMQKSLFRQNNDYYIDGNNQSQVPFDVFTQMSPQDATMFGQQGECSMLSMQHFDTPSNRSSRFRAVLEALPASCLQDLPVDCQQALNAYLVSRKRRSWRSGLRKRVKYGGYNYDDYDDDDAFSDDRRVKRRWTRRYDYDDDEDDLYASPYYGKRRFLHASYWRDKIREKYNDPSFMTTLFWIIAVILIACLAVGFYLSRGSEAPSSE